MRRPWISTLTRCPPATGSRPRSMTSRPTTRELGTRLGDSGARRPAATSGRLRGGDDVLPGLDDADLLARDLLRRPAEDRVVEVDLADHGDVASITFVASQRPPIPTSMTPTSTASSARCAKAIAVMSSKNVTGARRRRHAPRRARRSERASASTSGGPTRRPRGDRTQADHDPLTHVVEVRRHVGAGAQPDRLEHRGRDPDRRALAVRPGHVDAAVRGCGSPSSATSSRMPSRSGPSARPARAERIERPPVGAGPDDAHASTTPNAASRA
jgi:hypothetical protein